VKKISAFLICVFLTGILAGFNFFTPKENRTVSKKEIVPDTLCAKKKFIPYAYLVAHFVKWTKRTWTTIDLQEKTNYLLFKDPQNKKTLAELVFEGIAHSQIKAFADENFMQVLSYKELRRKMCAERVVKTFDSQGTVKSTSIFSDSLKSDDIVRLTIKEDWFFERERSVLNVEIISIAFERYNKENKIYKPLFWLYYPQCRSFFSKQQAINVSVNSQQRTFDELFSKRMFQSQVEKETNVYDNYLFSWEKALNPGQKKDSLQKISAELEKNIWDF
jgi:gliding motility associated protien GldN